MIDWWRRAWKQRREPAFGSGGDFSVLFVCTANVCRSPMAEALLRHRLRERGLAGQVAVDSCGTRVSPLRQRPDPRAGQVLRERGIESPLRRSRALREVDFSVADIILCMDRDNLEQARALCPGAAQERLGLVMEQAPGVSLAEVPDPYYGNLEGFRRVADLLDPAIVGLLDRIERWLREMA